MQMIVRHSSGFRAGAILLAAGEGRMRVAAAARRDIIELTLRDGRWYNESGEILEIEALSPIPGTDCSMLCAELYPLKMAAGISYTF